MPKTNSKKMQGSLLNAFQQFSDASHKLAVIAARAVKKHPIDMDVAHLVKEARRFNRAVLRTAIASLLEV
jgi:hypothetical protein